MCSYYRWLLCAFVTLTASLPSAHASSVAASSSVNLSASVKFAGRITLHSGWNLLSSPWIPQETTVQQVFAGVDIARP